uniref:DDE-1 domain-containing protein n=1 Tax=Heterorhabditis bacteriophora TaxID=37862 RepID=A0A1I7WHZ5_HETBA
MLIRGPSQGWETHMHPSTHMLPEKMKVNRYEKSKKLLRIVQKGRAPNVLFTAEKIFTVNPVCNSQNSRQILQRDYQRSGKASANSRIHFPSSVMVWAGITASDFWGKDIWPSKSADLNPMDFTIWSFLENKLSRTSYNNLDSLKVALVKSWNEISQEELRPVVGNFETRLQACVTAKGGNFEHQLN